MFSFLKKSKETTELVKKRELNNILQLAKDIMGKTLSKDNQNQYNKVPIQAFIKSVGSPVLQSEYMNLIKGIRIETTPQNLFEDIGIYLTPDLGFSKILSIDKNERKLFPVSLSNNLVIPLAWDTSRFVSCMSTIGNDVNSDFVYDVGNHLSFLILPLNILIMHNGNHSTLTGILKGEGSIFPTEIVDLSYMYESGIRFDGCHFVNSDGFKLHKVKYFELGTLYEIGRLLNESNISFLNEEQTKYLNQRKKSEHI